MRLFGFSLREWVRNGLGAIAFILVFKMVAPKANVPALTAASERI